MGRKRTYRVNGAWSPPAVRSTCPHVSGTGPEVRRSGCSGWGGLVHGWGEWGRLSMARQAVVRSLRRSPSRLGPGDRSVAPPLDGVATVRLGRGHHGEHSGVTHGSSCSPTRGHTGRSNTSSGERADPIRHFPSWGVLIRVTGGMVARANQPGCDLGVRRDSRAHDRGWPHISGRGRVFCGLASIAPTTARRWPPRRSCPRPGVPSARQVITPGWLGATRGGGKGWRSGRSSPTDDPSNHDKQCVRRISASHDVDNRTRYGSAVPPTTAQPYLRWSSHVTEWRNVPIMPEIRFLRSSHGDDHGSARRGDRRVRAGHLDRPAEVARISRPVGTPGDVAPGNAIAHTRRSTNTPNDPYVDKPIGWFGQRQRAVHVRMVHSPDDHA